MQFLPPPQPLLVFTAGSYGDLSSWHCSPGLGGLDWDWDPLLPRYLSCFLSTTHGCGTTHFYLHTSLCPSMSPHVSRSLHPPTRLGECGLFKSLVVRLPHSSIFWQFLVMFFFCSIAVFFAIFVRGGEACLPVPPSWPEFIFLYIPYLWLGLNIYSGTRYLVCQSSNLKLVYSSSERATCYSMREKWFSRAESLKRLYVLLIICSRADGTLFHFYSIDDRWTNFFL